jgi:hypothetical protein
MKQYNALIANRMLRYHDRVLSDEQVKEIRNLTDPKVLAQTILDNGPPFTKRQLQILVEAAGDMDEDHNFEQDGDHWRDDVLDKYADYIQNYKYTYNEEAKKLDPGIDTKKEHIGPMAQDIEKVNPAAVNADPKTGYKTVDTGRLALMNAGAIAELARQMKEIQHG